MIVLRKNSWDRENRNDKSVYEVECTNLQSFRLNKMNDDSVQKFKIRVAGDFLSLEKKTLCLEFYYQEFIKHFKHSSVIFNQYFPKMQSQV